MLVQQILNSKPEQTVVTLAPGSPVSDAVALLSEKKIGAVVIAAADTTPLGILSERDIVRELGRRGAVCLSELVDDMMTHDPVTCTTSATADQILTLMTEGRFRHLPVLKDGKMIGIITQGDVVKARLEELAMEKNALEGMIMGH